MAKLEGIVKLRGKMVVLENIENPVLKNVLHSRLSENKFNFWYNDTSYSQYTDKDPSKHTDFYSGSHTEYYKDSSHRDWNESTYNSPQHDWDTGHSESHSDKGYSEKVSYGYRDHTDHY